MRITKRRSIGILVITLLIASIAAPSVAVAKPSVHAYPEGPVYVETGERELVRAFLCDPADPDLPFGDDLQPETADDDCSFAMTAEFSTGSDTITVATLGGYGVVEGIAPGEGFVRVRLERGKRKKSRPLRDRVQVQVSGTAIPPAPLHGLAEAFFPGTATPRPGFDADPDDFDEDALISAVKPQLLFPTQQVGTGRPAANALLACFDEAGMPDGLGGFEHDGQRCFIHPGEVIWEFPDGLGGGLLDGPAGPVVEFWVDRPGMGDFSANWTLGDMSGSRTGTLDVIEGGGLSDRLADQDGDGTVDADDLLVLGDRLLFGDEDPSGFDLALTGRLLSEPLPVDDPGSGDVDGDGSVTAVDIGLMAALDGFGIVDPGNATLSVNGDMDGDGDIDVDDLVTAAEKLGPGQVIVVEPQKLTLLVGGRRRADAYVCDALLRFIQDPVTEQYYDAVYEPTLGLDGKAGGADDGCVLSSKARFAIDDPSVASVNGRSGLVTALADGETTVRAWLGQRSFGMRGPVMDLNVNEPPVVEEPPANDGGGRDTVFIIVPEEIRAMQGDMVFFAVLECGDSGCQPVSGIDTVELDDDGDVELQPAPAPWIALQVSTAEGFEIVRALIDAQRVIASLGILERERRLDDFGATDGLDGVGIGDISQLAPRRGAKLGDGLYEERFDLDGDDDIDGEDLSIAGLRMSDDGGDTMSPEFEALVSAPPLGSGS